MKKLQLYRIISEGENNGTLNKQFQENLPFPDYYSIYSQHADITLVNKVNFPNENEKYFNKTVYHYNPNLNEYHKMIQTKTFSESEKGNNKNYVISRVKMIDNFITIQLNTKDKLSE
jgi:hypothetical protein